MSTSTGPKVPKFRRVLTFCSANVAGKPCRRLPAHHGDHRAYVAGNGVRAPRAAQSKAVEGEAERIVTRAGRRYMRVTRKDGSIVLTPVVVATPDAESTR
jgi:hypothetical protein